MISVHRKHETMSYGDNQQLLGFKHQQPAYTAVHQNMTAKVLMDCATACAATHWCRSYNYVTTIAGTSKSYQCQLFTWSVFDPCPYCPSKKSSDGNCLHYNYDAWLLFMYCSCTFITLHNSTYIILLITKSWLICLRNLKLCINIFFVSCTLKISC